jgi:hypothetical protein
MTKQNAKVGASDATCVGVFPQKIFPGKRCIPWNAKKNCIETASPQRLA